MGIPKLDYRKQYNIITRIWNSPIPGKGTISRLLSKFLIPKASTEVICKTIYGFDILLNPVTDQSVEGALYSFGTYERGTLDFIASHLKSGQTFYDIGANIGLMSLHAAMVVGSSGKVYAFEANPETARILQYNIDLNSLSNITIINKAVGKTNDTMTLYNNGAIKNRGGASLIKPEVVSEAFEVDLISIDTHPQYGTSAVDMVKIDVEGFEMDVLKGMENVLRKYSPILIVECSADRNNNYKSVYEIYDFVKSLKKYKIYKLSRTKERSGSLREILSPKELPAHDNIFCLSI